MTNNSIESDIDQLNCFLRGEISAVETYAQAVGAVDNPHAKEVLVKNQASHAARVELLTREIKSLGGEPAEGSGPWGAFAKAVQGGAKLFGASAAISALEEGEQHGLNDYQGDFQELSTGARQMVASRLIPEQESSHNQVARLKAIVN